MFDSVLGQYICSAWTTRDENEKTEIMKTFPSAISQSERTKYTIYVMNTQCLVEWIYNIRNSL